MADKYEPVDGQKLESDYCEAIKDKKLISYADVRCKRCGTCCKGQFPFLGLTLSDVYELSRGLHLTMIETIVKYCSISLYAPGNLYMFAIDMEKGCPFYSDKEGCTIHGFKPESCRAFPFMEYNVTYFGDSSWYDRMPDCAYLLMDRDAIIRYDIETLVDNHLWTYITDAFIFNNTSMDEGKIKNFYMKARQVVADEEVRAIARNLIETQIKLNTIHRYAHKSVALHPDRYKLLLEKMAYYLPVS